MRILITNTGPWGTGSFVAVEAITRELIDLGHTVKIFFPDSGVVNNHSTDYYENHDLYSIWRFPISDGKTTIPTFPLMIPDPHPRNPTPLTYKELTDEQLELYFARLQEQLEHVINDFQPDVIESQHLWTMHYVLHKIGVDYIATAHHSDQMGFRYDERIRPYAIEGAKNARFVFAISECVKKEVEKLYHLPDKQVIIVESGYDERIFYKCPVNRQLFCEKFNLHIPDDAKLLTFAGKLSLTKGIDTIVAANNLLKESDNIHMLIFGAGNLSDVIGDDQDIEHLDRMHFLGHQDPAVVATAHNLAHLSIMPSRHEGFGLACLEAMACGIPVVVTRINGPDTYAVGPIIEPDNPEQLANAILEVVNLPVEKHEQLCKDALIKAHQFSWKAVAKERLKYYGVVANRI